MSEVFSGVLLSQGGTEVVVCRNGKSYPLRDPRGLRFTSTRSFLWGNRSVPAQRLARAILRHAMAQCEELNEGLIWPLVLDVVQFFRPRMWHLRAVDLQEWVNEQSVDFLTEESYELQNWN